MDDDTQPFGYPPISIGAAWAALRTPVTSTSTVESRFSLWDPQVGSEALTAPETPLAPQDSPQASTEAPAAVQGALDLSGSLSSTPHRPIAYVSPYANDQAAINAIRGLKGTPKFSKGDKSVDPVPSFEKKMTGRIQIWVKSNDTSSYTLYETVEDPALIPEVWNEMLVTFAGPVEVRLTAMYV